MPKAHDELPSLEHTAVHTHSVRGHRPQPQLERGSRRQAWKQTAGRQQAWKQTAGMRAGMEADSRHGSRRAGMAADSRHGSRQQTAGMEANSRHGGRHVSREAEMQAGRRAGRGNCYLLRTDRSVLIAGPRCIIINLSTISRYASLSANGAGSRM